jgi:hypothetical protein
MKSPSTKQYSELLKKLFMLTDQLSQAEIHSLIAYLKTQLDDDDKEEK